MVIIINKCTLDEVISEIKTTSVMVTQYIVGLWHKWLTWLHWFSLKWIDTMEAQILSNIDFIQCRTLPENICFNTSLQWFSNFTDRESISKWIYNITNLLLAWLLQPYWISRIPLRKSIKIKSVMGCNMPLNTIRNILKLTFIFW